MLDIAPSEFLLVAIVALVVIGPKDLPKALRVLGYWVGRARSVARQFRSGFDNMIREAELAEMEKKWAEENARIMREHGGIAQPGPEILPFDESPSPEMVEPPVVAPPAEPAPEPEAEAAPPPRVGGALP